MGLDMYLNAKKTTYFSTWSMKEVENKKKKITKEERLNKKIRKIIPEMFLSDNLNYVEISFEAGYWRKANQIHNWFVENIQKGKDECIPHYVSREDLKKLKEVCQEVLSLLKKCKTKKIKVESGWCNGKITYEEIEVYEDSEEIKDLLPTRSGCFFGGTEYSKYYKTDLEDTIKIIDKCLALPKEWEFQYYSSW